MPRKIVALDNHEGYVTVACDDGTIWEHKMDQNPDHEWDSNKDVPFWINHRWEQHPAGPIPQDN